VANRKQRKLFPGINSFARTFTARYVTVPHYALSRPSNFNTETTAVNEQEIKLLLSLFY